MLPNFRVLHGARGLKIANFYGFTCNFHSVIASNCEHSSPYQQIHAVFSRNHKFKFCKISNARRSLLYVNHTVIFLNYDYVTIHIFALKLFYFYSRAMSLLDTSRLATLIVSIVLIIYGSFR